MFERATDLRLHAPRDGAVAKRGSALVSSFIVIVALFGLVYVSAVVSSVEVRDSRRTVDDVRVKYAAEAGVEQAMHFLAEAVEKTNAYDPLSGLTGLFDDAKDGVLTPFLGSAMESNGSAVGSYTVSMRVRETTTDSVTIDIESTGYLPVAPTDLAPGETVDRWHAITATVQYSLTPSEVFDYAYFINNWGWFYGSTIICNGNARSNGQFDVHGYSPTVTGQPVYDDVAWNGVKATLSGYQDDNDDGLADGNDGGIFSSWDILDAHNVKGNGGKAANQHEFLDPVSMPNLSDLTRYETQAIADGASVKIGGSTVCAGVYGDGAGEKQNLYLVGTAADPIVIDGPVVVRGDLIISGYVTGQGSIYAGGNVYVPDSIQYLDGPTSPRPTSNSQSDTEQWLSDNWDKDFLGLFARENVVIGDHTDSTWRSYVSGWMSSSMNKSEEDAGEDGIPNTADGRDGTSGTADDDVLEDDNVFTVSYYTDADDALGLIPPGHSVGDVIPGSGEDIDGDGVYDDTTTLSDIDFSTTLDTSNWGGNMPVGGIASYSTIATNYAPTMDAVFYTNHSFCYVVLGGTTARINGALVSRNENIAYGTPTIEMNYDCRLLGGNSGIAGDLLPQVVQSPTILRWSRLENDPNRHRGVEEEEVEVSE